jgi:glycosyltransferase involved in cell wall biosynthesis
MKILYDYNIFALQKFGGISKYFVEIFKIIKYFHKSKVVAPVHTNFYLKEYKNKDIFNLFFFSKQYKYTRFVTKVINNLIFQLFIRLYKPDIVHLTYYSKKINFKKQCKIVITVYDLIHEIFEEKFNFRYPKKFKKNYILSSDWIICISENTKKDLIKFYNVDKKKISVIPLAYNKSKDFIKIDDIFLEFPYLLYVGARDNYKNFKNFIIAYSTSSKLRKDFRIVCFGGGSLNDSEKKLIQNLDIDISNVKHISGSDQQLNYVYMKAKAYVCPSLYEGFGLTILESMNMNCPIISSNAGSLCEVGGKAVEYFDPNNVDEIKKKIEKIVYSNKNIESQRKKFKLNLKRFSWELTAKKTINVYEKLQSQ